MRSPRLKSERIMGRASDRRAIQGHGNLLIYLFVVCVYAHMRRHTCVFVCYPHVCADVLMPEDVRCPALSPSPYSFDTESDTEPGSRLMASKSQRSKDCLLQQRITGMHSTTPSFLHRCQDLNSDPQTWTASDLTY